MTGAIGLIGQAVVRWLVALGANVMAIVRDAHKARNLFSDILASSEKDAVRSLVVMTSSE